MNKLKIILIICLTFSMLGCIMKPEVKEYCTPDYCIEAGQTLEQIGVN